MSETCSEFWYMLYVLQCSVKEVTQCQTHNDQTAAGGCKDTKTQISTSCHMDTRNSVLYSKSVSLKDPSILLHLH